MTRYDDPPAGDGHGGPHPLACVPQAVLDAARDSLEEMTLLGRFTEGKYLVLDAEPGDRGSVEAISDSIVAAVLAAIEETTGKHPYQPSATIRIGENIAPGENPER